MAYCNRCAWSGSITGLLVHADEQHNRRPGAVAVPEACPRAPREIEALTARQREVLDLVSDFRATMGRDPSVRELAEALDVHQSTMSHLIVAVRAKGLWPQAVAS